MFTTNWAMEPVIEVAPGVTRQSIDGANQTLIRYVYHPGAVFAVHQHPQEQITIVLSGVIAFSIDGATVTLREGDLVVIPASVPHGAHVIGDDVVETLNMLSPKRESHPSA